MSRCFSTRESVSMVLNMHSCVSSCLWVDIKISCPDKMIKNNAWVTVNNDFLVTGGVICQSLANHLTSDQKIIIHGNECIILFLKCCYILKTLFCYKQSSIAHFAIVTKYGIFWLNIVTSSQLICDVTWTRGTGIVMSYSWLILDCSCPCKLVQRRSSLMNNNHEYRILTTRYSRLSM